MQYKIKESYKENILSVQKTNDSIKIYIISDKQENQDILLNIHITDFYSTKPFIKTKRIHIDSISNKQLYSFSIKDIDTTGKAFFIEITSLRNRRIDSKVVLLSSIKNTNLPKDSLNITHKKHNGDFIVTIKSKTLVKNLWVDVKVMKVGNFSDNNFDLMPGEEKTIRAKIIDIGNNQPEIIIKSLNNIYN
jgi:hypothetical protein